MKISPIETLNEDAKKNFFDLESLPWSPGVDRTKLFGPEDMSHLYYCPSYQLLTTEEKRYYNQVHGMGVAEQFIFLEEILLVRGLESIVARQGARLPAPLKQAIATFVEEEIKHSAMFARLLAAADPEVYGKSRWDVYKLSRSEYFFFDVCLKMPEIFLWWIWLAVVFEEKTLDFYRKYKAVPDRDSLDPLFYAVHRYHAIDEVRHFQLDHHFIDQWWVPAPSWKKWINKQIFSRMMWSFTHPRRTVRHALEKLLARFPRLEAHREAIFTECLVVYKNPAWQEAFYSRSSLPHTFALLDRFPEMHSMRDVFPMFTPRPHEHPDAALHDVHR